MYACMCVYIHIHIHTYIYIYIVCVVDIDFFIFYTKYTLQLHPIWYMPSDALVQSSMSAREARQGAMLAPFFVMFQCSS